MKIDFKARQHEFAAYIKNPLLNSPPDDVKPERMAIYRQLFLNNIDSFLSSNFPVIKSILNTQQWQTLTADFFARHHFKTPYFAEIPEEFLAYLQDQQNPISEFPFLQELAHYEWVEMALAIAQEELPPKLNPDEISKSALRLSPLAWPLAYQYPVHRISADFLPQTPPVQTTFLVIYRDENDDVIFLEITPLIYRLLDSLQNHNETGINAHALINQLATDLPEMNPEILQQGTLQILKELAGKQVIFGF